MKTIKLFTILFIALSMWSCNDTEGAPAEGSEEVLLGTWNMTKAYGGISGTVYDIPKGDIVWTFNIQSNTLTVANNHNPDHFDGALASGTYTYQIVDAVGETPCTKTLVIDGNDFGCFSRTDTGLTISQVHADGLMLDFVE
ncbi:hypothetical protein HYN48_09085 [Flavobacterium magnum]|uniref:Lipocalin-like domain-containing protein n=1 Tax=Flavobacterium magnum TaxID=2162713 RepID=A0A2S0RHM3_9FLAO|nr:hypothetical protein [Flavobacterium magnum]AWA30222.1 hypothetical protein HYN48_09085 [Flavobacterium magnum]